MKLLTDGNETLRACFVPSTLYVVATPIGNLADFSVRAKVALDCADIICAEDTRVTKRLLHVNSIHTKLVSVREHNEEPMAKQVCQCLSEQKIVVYVADAGTPAVADPGSKLVDMVWKAGFRVSPIPGPCAAVSALSASGVRGSGFLFAGFLPNTSKKRRAVLARWQSIPYAVICYEAPHRLIAWLSDAVAELGEARELILAREITKKFETIHRLPAIDLLHWVKANNNQQRGEITLIIQPPHLAETDRSKLSEEDCRVMTLLSEAMPIKKAVPLAVKITGCDKRALYQWALTLKNKGVSWEMGLKQKPVCYRFGSIVA